MRSRLISIPLLLLILYTICDANQLKGCRPPKVTGEALKAIAAGGLLNIRSETLKEKWPGLLMEICTSTQSEELTFHNLGRFINDICECCETFQFTLDSKYKRSTLKTMVLYYSSTEKDQVAKAASLFTAAIGPPDMKIVSSLEERLKKQGSSFRQFYDWQATPDTLWMLELNIDRGDDIWTLHFVLSHGSLRTAPEPNSPLQFKYFP